MSPRASRGRAARFPRVGGWELLPEGGVVHRAEEVAVIADVHLGYEWARGSAGDCVPAHSLAETVAKLAAMRKRLRFRRLVIAGDVVESPRPCARTAADLSRLCGWLLDREVELVLVQGNHDRSLPAMAAREGFPARGVRLEASLVVDGWTIEHGHRAATAGPVISGHHHPVLRAAGQSASCFLAGPDRIILPAFSPNAAGLDVLAARLPEACRGDSLRCLVSTGAEVLDFGPLATLAARLGRADGPAPPGS
ncbi:Calcineurin-like phosphoesterase [Aquisphaera giovannonii]|uniref:Calcineurin-like phosphoesterase n=1 Tax=Aquisphaera giovannonii TaxID=406548 RepID=A0A5B9W1T1_9BACT|nr:metallophosphoesterase [Aquisphaera giovannonii]QEH34612.1 Calcineurin-like phosphoesterase [Aquisphaera giovannonii]